MQIWKTEIAQQVATMMNSNQSQRKPLRFNFPFTLPGYLTITMRWVETPQICKLSCDKLHVVRN